MSITSRVHDAPKRRTAEVPRKLSRLHKPETMSLEAWQIALRRQVGWEETFTLTNVGDQPIFSEFHVTNPKSGNTYRVVHAWAPRAPPRRPCFPRARLGAALQRGVRAVRGAARGAISSAGGRAGRYFDSDYVLRPETVGHFEDFVAETRRLDPGRRCYDDALALVAQMRDDERRVMRLASAFPRGSRSGAFKGLLRLELHDYQRRAALFAARAGRCLIADDMGLGKTIETIAAVEIMARYLGVERVLVICPTSLKHQWEREITRAIGRSVVVVGGLRAHRESAFRAENFYKVTKESLNKSLALAGTVL